MDKIISLSRLYVERWVGNSTSICEILSHPSAYKDGRLDERTTITDEKW